MDYCGCGNEACAHAALSIIIESDKVESHVCLEIVKALRAKHFFLCAL